MRPTLSVVMSTGVLGRLLRASLGRLGGSWGPSWGLLAAPLRPWAAPGASWVLSYSFLAAPGRLWAALGTCWGPSGRVLGASWGLPAAPGGLLGRSGRLLGQCIKHRQNRVFYVFLGFRASPGGLWGGWRPVGRPWVCLGLSGAVLGWPGRLLDRPGRLGRVSPGRRKLPGLAQRTSSQVKKSSKSSLID